MKKRPEKIAFLCFNFLTQCSNILTLLGLHSQGISIARYKFEDILLLNRAGAKGKEQTRPVFIHFADRYHGE